ncbi:MAG: hypothetical protein M1840_001657 [Geoglossum simile]|nr:MAG: hypothetical protein M1840_001657 [Geoglossum simile]
MEATSALLSPQRTQQGARIKQDEPEPKRKQYCRSDSNGASSLQPRKRAHIDQDEPDQPKVKRYCRSENGVASLRPRFQSAGRSLKVSPATSPEFEVKGASTPHPEAGPQGDDGDNRDDRLQKKVGENSITGKGFRPTESAPQTLNGRPRPQSHSFDQESSRPNTLKAGDKDTQQDCRCPKCSFPCWLCRYSIEDQGIYKDESSDYDYDYDYDGSDSRDEEDESNQLEETGDKPSKRRNRADRLVYLGPTDENFEELILLPVGVRVLDWDRRLRPGELPSDGIQNDPSMASRVYLDVDYATAEDISTQITSYNERRYEKQTFAKLVSQYVAPIERYIDPMGPQVVVPLSRDKWKPRKEGPPPLPATGYIYDWDIKSDMTYMVALNLFEKDLRVKLQTQARDLLAEPAGVCPYLTFKLQSAGSPGEDRRARCEISAASVLWLSHRKKLKDRLNSSDFSDLRHYSIVVNSRRYQIWEAGFDGRAYSVQMVARDTLGEPEGVLRFAEWSNAIHRWGLGPNARAFKRDVEALLGGGVTRWA